MRKYFGIIGVLLLAGITFGGGPGWTNDINEGWLKARKEKKDILVNLTGTDWCTFCVRLEKYVFKRPEFYKHARKHFVMVEMDFPKSEEKRAAQPERIKRQNKKWKKKLNSSGYPSVYLLDLKGKPYACKIGYQGQRPAEYLKDLIELKKIRVQRDKYYELAFKSKDKMEGLKYLDKSLSCMDAELISSSYKPMVSKFIRMDPKNQLGFKEKYQNLAEIITLKKQINRLAAKKNLAELDTKIERLMSLTDGKGRDIQYSLHRKGVMLAKTKPESAKEVFLAAREAAPESELVEAIENDLKKIERVLK